LIVLGSRSPRRRELLAALVSPQRIRVVPPRSADEPGFEGADTWPAIEARLQSIAHAKCEDVRGQLAQPDSPIGNEPVAAVIAADTVIVATGAAGNLVVLGQPRERDWESVVKRWFREFYFGKTHTAATGLCVETASGRRVERIVKTAVMFRADGQRWLDWYMSTGEPRGKAGGYAIQEAGSIFAERIDGSLSNVVGLPLEAVLDVFAELNVDVT
jgi:septum formation protein